MKKYLIKINMNIFIHRRDLRINDNNSLSKISEIGNVTPIFIFNPTQIYEKKNPYFSNNLVEFMCNSLIELKEEYENKNITLNFFEGEIINILEDINNKYNINSIGFNLDYSPFSKKRDNDIIKWAEKNNIKCITEEDMLLFDIKSEKGLNPNTKKPYVKFTPYFKNLSKYKVESPKKNKLNGSKVNINIKSKINDISKYYIKNQNKHVKAGRKQALAILKNVKKFNEYDDCRNFLTYKTTHLSPYINLGNISIREVYKYVKDKISIDSGIIRELFWRDFYYNILYHYPHVIGSSFKENYNKIKWENDKKKFNKWKNGETGFPIVDACMNQLNTTGYMHNRGRMIVASFLTKDLLIDWKWGEKYFATRLIDYNQSANNGGWQWAAGTGTDAQPYFRIFNPWTQSEKFDKNCLYIKKWIPELENVENNHIHKWFNFFDKKIYYEPMVDHAEARKKTLDVYKSV